MEMMNGCVIQWHVYLVKSTTMAQDGGGAASQEKGNLSRDMARFVCAQLHFAKDFIQNLLLMSSFAARTSVK